MCYEPWNRELGQGMPPEQTPSDLIAKFNLKVDPGADIFVLKETTVDFKGIQWLARFLRHNAGSSRVQVVWSLRAYRHTYLSFVEGARKWWGHKDMVPGVDGYNQWVERSRKATGTLLGLYQEFPGALYAYESLTAEPTTTIPRLMAELGLEFSDQQLDYLRHFSPEQVRGDVSMENNARPISIESVTKRELEWELHQSQLSEANGDALRQQLDQFWLAVDQRRIIPGKIPISLLPGGVSFKEQARPGHEYREEFSSRSDWQKFAQSAPAIFDHGLIDSCASNIARRGFHFRGEVVKPAQIGRIGKNYRESFSYQGINSRKRAVLVELFHDLRSRQFSIEDARIYAPEALGGFATFLAQEFSHFQGSEYLPDPAQRRKLATIEHQDLSALTYPDAAFDYVLVNDIFEHLPDLGAVLGQIQRVLAPGGVLLSTFPFALQRDEHLVKAVLNADGSIDYLTEPEYHEDPVDKQGVLVFQVPGWEILKDCHSLGFASANMVFLASPARGILVNNISGEMLLKAVNPN